MRADPPESLDIEHVMASPFHWQGRQWLLISASTAAVPALSLADESVSGAGARTRAHARLPLRRYFNRRLRSGQKEPESTGARLTLLPLLGDGTLGASASLDF